jgi:hypothetical protein
MSENETRPPTGGQKPVYGPRRVLPWAGIFVGAFLTYRGATGEMGSIFLITGPALMALGVIMFFVYRWMAKRGL